MKQGVHRLALLGEFSLTAPEQPISLTDQLQRLVAYLALHPDVVLSRRQLAYRLWPDSGDAQARTNLRNLLFKLRQAWPASTHIIHIDRAAVQWRAEASREIDVDTHAFLAAVQAAQAAPDAGQALAWQEQAVGLYRGELLPNFYDDWVLQERERFHDAYAHAAEAWIAGLTDQRRYDEALDHAQRLRDQDPLREASYRRLMELYALRGDRAAALRVYHACATLLERELETAPAAETQAIHARLLRGSDEGESGDNGRYRNATSQPAPHPDGAHAIPLVGREAEWQRLLAAWRQAHAGNTGMVLIRGEAGIGKTRLAEELLDRARRQGLPAAATRTYAAGGALTYAPIAEWLRTPPLRQALDSLGTPWLAELARLLPELAQAHPHLPPPGPLQEGWQRQRFFEAVARGILAAGNPEGAPILLHMDDLQWSDGETLQLLHFLLRHDSGSPRSLLITGTARTEELPQDHPLHGILWQMRQDGLVVEMELGPLDPAASAALAQHAADRPLDEEDRSHLYARTEGHPLFIVETMRMADAGSAGMEAMDYALAQTSGGQAALPDSPKIQAVIAARLHQLSPAARELAQVAAVVGRSFRYAVLRGASSGGEDELVAALDELWQRRIVREQGAEAYDFSHDRIREVAYAEISRARRRLLHRRVAGALELLHRDNLAGVCGEIAVHFEEAGDDERAQHYHRRAGEYAMARFASGEAEHHLRAALARTPAHAPAERFDLLEMLQTVYYWQSLMDKWGPTLDAMEALAGELEEEPEALRAQALCAAYRASWFATQGRPDERARKAQEAVGLAEKADDLQSLALGYIQWGFSRWDVSLFREARPLLQKGAELARQAGMPDQEEMALEMLAALGMFTGMPAAEIEEALDRCWAIAQEQQYVICMASLCNKYGYLPVAQGEGDYDEARRWYVKGIEMARPIGDVRDVSQCLINLIVLETVDGDYTAGAARREEFLDQREGALIPLNRGRFLNYWGDLLTNVGQFDAAREQQLQSLDVLLGHGQRHFAVKTLVELAWLHHLMGDHEAGLASAAEALAIVATTGDTRYQAIALTRQGYALHGLGDTAGATQAFTQAHDLHRQMEQHNRSTAPLAGLARIAQEQGDPEQAQALALRICDHLHTYTLDRTIEGCRVYLTCYRILAAAGDPDARWVLETAWAQLQRRAATIDNPDWLHTFWQAPEHIAIQQAASAQI